MLSSPEAPNECTYEVSVEIPWDAVEKERSLLVSNVAKTAVVPGFRRGRVPAPVLNRHYEGEILDSLKERLIPQYLVEEVSKRDVQVAFGPLLRPVRFVEGEPLKATAVFEVFPEFELGEYRRLRFPAADVEVTDQMVDDYLETLRQRHASYQNLDPRPMVDGDIAVASIKGFADGDRQIVDQKDAQFEIGHEDTLEPISDALRGSMPGDTLEFEITYPDDHSGSVVAGKTVQFQADVTGLQKCELPDLDDEFATDVDNSIATLDDLKAGIRKQMEAAYQESANRAVRQEAITQLAKAHPMPLPPYYFARRVLSALEEAKEQAGLEPKDTLPDRESALVRAVEAVRVRAEQVLDRIASVEGMSISNAEVEQEILRYAESEQMTPERAKRELDENGALGSWRLSTLRAKALQFVIDEAERYDPSETEESVADGKSDSASDGAE